MKHKISFAGIDGSGKSTCLDLLISKLDSTYSIMKIGTPYVFFKGERNLIIKHGCFRAVEHYKTTSRQYRFYGIMEEYKPNSRKSRFHSVFLIFNFIYKFLVSKYLEVFKRGELIMFENDLLLQPLVYMAHHLPMTKIVKKSLRFRILSILFGSKSDFSIFYLDTEPEVAIERIHKRGIHIDSHENTKDLKRMKKEFDDIIEVASENGFEIFRINTNNKSLDEVANQVQTILEKKLSGSI